MDSTTGLEAIGTGISFVMEQCKDVLVLVAGSPILSLGIAAWIAGLGIGLFKRLV